MSDDDRRTAGLAMYHALADATENWIHLDGVENDLQGRLAVAALFALDGTELDLVDVNVTLVDDTDYGSVEVVIVAPDRLVIIDHEPGRELQTRVLGRTAIRSVELLELPSIMSDRVWARRGPIVIRLVLEDGQTFEIGNHAATPKLREQIESALPQILSRLS